VLQQTSYLFSGNFSSLVDVTQGYLAQFIQKKKKRNKRDIPGKKKCHPPPTHQNPHQHNPSVYKNMSY